MEPDKKLQDRLARVEGQVRGLRKMLEERRGCEDVLNQLLLFCRWRDGDLACANGEWRIAA